MLASISDFSSTKILKIIFPHGFLIGFDKDREAILASLYKLKDYSPNFLLIKSDFRTIDTWLEQIGIEKVDGIFFDLGISSYQIDNKERGFSFRSDILPDMRMNQEMGEGAWEVIKKISASELSYIFKKYGEIKNPSKMVRLIKKNIKNISTANELANLIEANFPKKRKIHPATLVFQALRIFVNDELNALEDLLSERFHVFRQKKVQ